jgi:hypothetical protein
MAGPTPAIRAVDPDNLIDGARAALIANSTIATALDIAHHPTRIASEVIAQGVTPPYIVLDLASVVYDPVYETVVNVLMDVSCYTAGDSTTVVRQLIDACITALVDTAWTATGFAVWSVTMSEQGSGIRHVAPQVVNGVTVRGRQFTPRIRAARV